MDRNRLCLWGLLVWTLCRGAGEANASPPGDLSGGPGVDFTLVVLPDTQFYACDCRGGASATFAAQTRWIVEQAKPMGIAYVAHVGDIVQYGDTNIREWENASAAMGLLENPATTHRPDGIPYGVAVGDHDQGAHGDPAGPTRYFNQFFGARRFAGRAYYGGHREPDNDNHYILFSAGGLDFIAIHLEHDDHADARVLDWASQLLDKHATRRGIVVSHHLLDGDGNLSRQGRATYDALKPHANLFLMLCGHVSAEKHRADTYEGRTVYTVLADYQRRPNGGDGWLRILQFSPAKNEIHVRTYSPTLGRFENDEDSDFKLPYDMGNRTTLPADLDAGGRTSQADVTLFMRCLDPKGRPMEVNGDR